MIDFAGDSEANLPPTRGEVSLRLCGTLELAATSS